jgi:protocatechuate 3,4-dioxygenase beta subunit
VRGARTVALALGAALASAAATTPAAQEPETAKAPAGAEATLVVAPAGEPGTRLVVDGTLRAKDGSPVAGAGLRIYQTDATGSYTPERPMDEPHARLSGQVRTDARGRFRLITIRPGGYPKALRLGDRDRKIPAHIHIDITATGHEVRRLQMVFADDPLLEDAYWSAWVRRLGQPVLATRAAAEELQGELAITLP